ncbi:TauD/TfdA family dioxygenase, partial [Nonomuraea sp. RK-328]|nr:TauD/TfdA family dioxygenase [Nonomuraea sp. RK-328]
MRRLSVSAGIEVDAAELPAQSPAASITSLVRRHGLVLIRDIPLSRDEITALGPELGTPVTPPFLTELSPGGGVSVLERRSETEEHRASHSTSLVFASGWHTDWSFLPAPPTLSLLYCEVAPEVGGDTLFCDTALGLEGFSSTYQGFLRTLRGLNTSSRSFSARGVYSRATVYGAPVSTLERTIEAIHPVIADSFVSETEVVFVNPSYTSYLVELEPHESSAVLGHLYGTLFSDENLLRINWRNNTLTVWDNYRFMHRAMNSGIRGERRLLRLNIRTEG